MSSTFPSFVAAFLAVKRLPCDADETERQFYGQFRKAITSFTEDMVAIMPYLEFIISSIAHQQYKLYRGQSWDSHWKEVSREGFDLVKGRTVDYGNVEYNVILGCMVHNSPFIKDCMQWFGTHYFETLRPNSPFTSHSCEMHGDIVEICMAALLGHIDFYELLPPRDGSKLFAKLCSCCRTVQMLDGVFRTGIIKWKNQRVVTLGRTRPELVSHPFVHSWLTDPRNAFGDFGLCVSPDQQA